MVALHWVRLLDVFGLLEILAQGGDCWVYGPKSEPPGRHGLRHGRAAG